MEPVAEANIYGQRLERYPPQIRLLTIEPAPHGDDDPIKLTAYRFNLDFAPKYVALSYVWGSPAITREIILNGTLFDVTVNLFAALRTLRMRNDIWFIWVDALCINQDDIVEKNGQLPFMGHIYSRASTVVSWLGESNEDISQAFAFIKSWVTTEDAVRVGSYGAERLADTLNVMKNPFNDLYWRAVRGLLNRPYWRRLWIVQEFYATTALILCGNLELVGADILQAVRIWNNIISTEFETSSLTTAAEKDLIRSCNLAFFQRTVQERARPLTYNTPYADRPTDIARLIEAMFATSDFETTDPRDKVFALVAFLELSEIPLRQDYSMTPPQLYKELMLYALEDRGLSNLTMISYAGTGHSSSRSSLLPSWVPDFEGRHPYLEEYSRVDKAVLTYWRTPTPWLLRTRGILFDKIVEISPPGTNDMRRLWKWSLFAASVRGDRVKSGGIPWRVALYRTLTRSTFEDPEAYFKHFKTVYFSGFIRAMRQAFKKYEMTSWFTDHLRLDWTYEERPEYEVTLPSVLAIENEALFWSRDSRLIMEEEFGGYSKRHDETLWGEQYKKNDDYHFWQRFNSPITTKRVFFVTEMGYMGLAPMGTRQGDQVAVLLGCRVPLIVRNQQESFELVGDAYVCGLMEGQIMEAIRARSTMLEDILFR